jgi:hypothetical protein
VSHFYNDGRYTYAYDMGAGGYAYGYFEVAEDSTVCIAFVNGFSRCDAFVENGGRLVLITRDGDRFPIRAKNGTRDLIPDGIGPASPGSQRVQQLEGRPGIGGQAQAPLFLPDRHRACPHRGCRRWPRRHGPAPASRLCNSRMEFPSSPGDGLPASKTGAPSSRVAK